MMRRLRSNVEITCSLEEREQEPMATDAIASDNYRERQKVTDSGHDIDMDVLFKRGNLTDEDIRNIIDDVSSDPEDKKTLLEILALDDEGTDSVDGAPISNASRISIKKDFTYVGLLAATENRPFTQRDVLFRHCLKNPGVIPSCILARGSRAFAAYGRALIKSGRTLDKRIKVILIGQEGAGKTSLGRSLRGEPFNINEQQTGGIQIHDPRVNATEGPWQYPRRKYSSVAQQRTDAQNNTADPVHVDGNCFTSQKPLENEDVGAISKEIAASVLEEIPELDEVDSSSGIWPVIWEMCGKGLDRALHPIFMSPDAIYLLVFDLSKDMPDLEANEGDSSFDHIVKYVDMIHSMGHAHTNDDDVSSPIFLIGTRADCEQSREKMKRLCDRLCTNPLIEEHVLEQFTVDNTKAGQATEKEDFEVVRLRRKILEAAKWLPHIKKEIPSRWLGIESTIEEQIRNDVKFMSKGNFMANICTVEDRKDVDEILHFLHNRGTIVCHDYREDGLVVLDPQWLLNIIHQILNVETSENESMKLRRHRTMLQEKGILTDESIDIICQSLGVSNIKQSLILIMENFNLICPLENKSRFLVPCMLSSIPEREIIRDTDNGGPRPLYLTFKTQYVPMGLFPKLLSLFREWAASKTSCEQQRTYANAACFILQDKNFLGFVCYGSVIKLQVWSQGESNRASSCLPEVLSHLQRSLATIRDSCHWLRHISWDLSIRCSLCGQKEDPTTGLCLRHGRPGCLHEACAHFMPLKDRQYYCPHAKGLDTIIPEEAYHDWLLALENNYNIQKSTHPSTKPSAVKGQFTQDRSKIQVTLLSVEWGSSKGGLPTVNRLLATELAKSPKLEVTLYVSVCCEEDEREANSYGIKVVKAKKRPGYEALDCLGFRPFEGFLMDVVIGHGVKLGKQAQLLKQFYPNCVWVQFEHTAPEELAMFKNYNCNISIGEEKHDIEVQLSEMADLVVAVGPKLAEVFRTYLRPYPEKDVFEIVPSPSIFREFDNCEQAEHDGEKFNVLVFGRGDKEDFELKGYDIPPKAIAELNDHRYHLYFVGAAREDMENVATRLLQNGISKSQLTVRRFIENREDLAKQLCQVDLALMPSRTEGFGLTALEALTAGLPILVGANSGFAEAMKKIEKPGVASSCIVESEDAKAWATAIRAVKDMDRRRRLNDATTLKANFEKTFNWSLQCGHLIRKILVLVQGKRNEDEGSQSKTEDKEIDTPDSALAKESSQVIIMEDAQPMNSQEVPKPPERETVMHRRSRAKEENHYMETSKKQRKEDIRKFISQRKPLVSIFVFLAFALVLLVCLL